MKVREKVLWYVNRLRCMQPMEVVHRIKNKLQAEKERFIGTGAEQVPEAVIVDVPSWISLASAEQAPSWIAEADKIMAGTMKVFNLSGYVLGNPPQWNIDPKTATVAPLYFGKTMNYRDEAVVGDIKYLWEPSRHIQLVPLCMAFRLTGEQRYLQSFRTQLQSWFEQCPYMQGPQWVSSLEMGIRLINWSICWQLIDGRSSELFSGERGQVFLKQWLDSIYQHCHFINGHYSRFSSANNHLIGEASGVYVAAQTWPFWQQMASWQSSAKNVLETESQVQNFADGVNKEQAISYQQFVLDFLLIPYLASINTGPFSSRYLGTIESMMEYLTAMIDVSGNVPMIGDADDGYAVKLDYSQDFCPYRSLLATGAVLFERPDFKHKGGSFDGKSQVLLGADLARHYEQLAMEPYEQKQVFREGGYYILGDRFNTEEEVKMVVDAGPLGYSGIAAHGHADALHLYLSVAGVEILVDPGTYAYHTEKKWRNYFRGTSAHNTIRIDGLDQSQIGGNFMWLDKADTEVESFLSSGSYDVLRARHNGYMRLVDPVLHQREISYAKAESSFEISDIITCNSSHIAEQFWHFAEDTRVELVDVNCIYVKRQGVELKIYLAAAESIDVVNGSDDLPLGWISRSFDNKQASPTVVARYKLSGTTKLLSCIKLKKGNDQSGRS